MSHPRSGESIIGVLAVTNKRIIFSGNVLFSSEFKDFDIKKITSVNFKSLILGSNMLTINSSSDQIEVKAIGKNAGQKVVNKIKEIQNQYEFYTTTYINSI